MIYFIIFGGKNRKLFENFDFREAVLGLSLKIYFDYMVMNNCHFMRNEWTLGCMYSAMVYRSVNSTN